MNINDLKSAILKQPSLLQYSVESSLRPKLCFLTKELSIPTTSISRIIRVAPTIMGSSLEHNLRPTVATLKEKCDFGEEEFASLIITAPLILSLSLKQKIEPCLTFVSNILSLSTATELGDIIGSTPRILYENVESSLAIKFQMLQRALEQESIINQGKQLSESKSKKTCAEIFRNNPALLATTNSILEKRIYNYLEKTDLSLKDAMRSRTTGRKKKWMMDEEKKGSRCFGRSVILISDGDKPTTMQRFTSVREASRELELSTSSIYRSCKSGRKVKGKVLKYADEEVTLLNESSKEKGENFLNRDIENEEKLLQDAMNVMGLKSFEILNSSSKLKSKLSIVAFVSGGIFPSDDINTARGRRKAGGFIIHLPQFNANFNHQLKFSFQEAAKNSFGMIMPESLNATDYRNGIVAVGFPFLRPSRNRVELYSCHGALKLILQLLKSVGTSMDLSTYEVNIDICTDSPYAWKYLKDSEQIFEWGSAPSLQKFEINGIGPAEHSNPDLLYPLSKTLYNMKTGNVFGYDKQKINIGKSIDITFWHSAEKFSDLLTIGYMTKLKRLAKEVSIWQYEK